MIRSQEPYPSTKVLGNLGLIAQIASFGPRRQTHTGQAGMMRRRVLNTLSNQSPSHSMVLSVIFAFRPQATDMDSLRDGDLSLLHCAELYGVRQYIRQHEF